ncbi:MAG: hypothetical protein Q8L51_01420 [Candidatus Amesbacteria bacterium]|nr:hypothetical protein [Candidatus Amesbacteria bacterium]
MFLSWRVVRRAGVLPSMMKIKVFIMSVVLMALSGSSVLAEGAGYINVYGYGPNNSANATHAGNYCNVNTGECTASGGNWVVRFECAGKPSNGECKDNESGWTDNGKLGVKNVGCGRTAQVDVLGGNCRAQGGACWDTWKDYLVYYGGDCGGTTTTTTTTSAPGCDSSQVNMNVNPNPARVGDNMSFVVGGNQGSTWVEDSWSGGVSCSGGFWGNKGCNANSAGSYTWTHVWYNTAQNDFNTKSARCEKSVSYSINGSNPTPTPTPTPFPTPTPTPTPAPGATPTPTPTPTPVATVTPKTGFDLYSTVSVLMTSGWAGFLLLRKRRV